MTFLNDRKNSEAKLFVASVKNMWRKCNLVSYSGSET